MKVYICGLCLDGLQLHLAVKTCDLFKVDIL